MDSLSDCIVVSPILDALLCKLDSLFSSAGNWSLATRQERQLRLTELRQSIEKILIPVLIEERKIKIGINPVVSWLADVQKAAYKTDDILDLVSTIEVRNSTRWSLNCLFSPSPEVPDQVEVPASDLYLTLQISRHRLDMDKIGRMSGEFKKLLNEKKQQSNDTTNIIIDHFQRRSSTNLEVVDQLMPLLQSNKVFGRDVDKTKMLDLLIDHNIDHLQQLSVIPIWGADGIGKTTLARVLYNDEKVLKHFDLRVWVSCNAQGFDEANIAKRIIDSVTGFPLQPEEMGELNELVRDALESKRCLIVLDDIQKENNKALDNLKKFFTLAALGSKVIVTTPTRQVASVIGTGELYQLSELSSEYSCSMFMSYLASDSSNAIHNSKLSSVVKIIVDRCRGLPLLLDLTGSLLRFEKQKRDLVSFEKFLEEIRNLISSFDPLHDTISNHLLLSYCNLPPHLKKCFGYCSILTRGHVLNKEKMIQMWIAEGLVQSFDGKKRLEDIGNNYFRELVSRSFFTELSSSDSGDRTECHMHGLIYDLAKRLTCDKVDGVECGKSRDLHQLSLDFSSGLSTMQSIPKTVLENPEQLRTLLLLSAGNFSGTLDHLLFRFKRLRVLDVSCSGIDNLSGDFGNLKHLRYLDLSHTFIKKLPTSIASLTNLQTLNLFGCYSLEELPEKMHKLTNLRHLDIGLCRSLSHMPSGIGLLTSLQSMPVFVLGKYRGCARLGELRRLNLTGKLEIKNLENESSLIEARDAKLYQKENLHHLGLSWGHNVNESGRMLESLRPHPNLQVLDITGNGDTKIPSWMRDSSIHNLVKVSIRNCRFEELPPLGQLPYLKELCVKGMSNLKSIGPEFYGHEYVNGFPALEQFELSDMPILVEWSETPREQGFPCLNMLTVEGCPHLKGIPFLPVLKDLVLWNSNEKLPCSIAPLTSLSSLVINEFRTGCSFDNKCGNFNSVKKLMIHNSGIVDDQLKKGMMKFTSLQHLGILRCFELKSLRIGFEYLSSIEKLDIIDCPVLEITHEVMESLPSLREWIIADCPKLDSLPRGLCRLTRLQKLIIKRCPELSCLPEGLEVTDALQFLLITGCPQLEPRLQKDEGEDWSKIAHIPCIIIGHDG